MKLRLILLAFLAASPAMAADNAVVVTPGSGVTMRSVDVGAGVQSMGQILVGSTGTAIYGTAGTANANVLTVQGIASMTPFLANPGTPANWAIAATGAAVPANAIYMGINTAGNLVGWTGAVTNTGTFAVQAAESGTWNITNISGTVSLPTGASTSALQTTGNTALTTINTTLGSPFQAGGSIGNTTFAATQATAASLNATVVGTGTFATQLTGATNNINNIAGTITLPTLASTSTKQSDGSQKTQIVDGSGNVIASTSNNLNVQCANCSGSGVSAADAATFTAGTSLMAPAGGQFTTGGATACVTGHECTVGITAARAFLTDMASIAGATTLTGNGTTGTGSPRVTIASDNTAFSVNANAGTNLNTSALATSANLTAGTMKSQIVDGSGNVIASTSNNLNVQCANCSGSGVSTADEATFTAGTSLFAGSGGFFQTTATSNPLSTGQQGMFQLTANRALFTNLRTAAGVEIGVAAAPVQVSLANTGANGTAVAVSLTSTTLTGTSAVNTAQVNGVTTLTGTGAVGTGTQRVAVGTDTATIAGSAPGTAGSASSNVVTVQGVASMTKLLVTPDSVALPANQSVNVSQINGVTPLMGNGTTGTGSQRVTIASDNTAFSVNAAATIASGGVASGAFASGAFATGSFLNATAGDPCMFQAKTNLPISTASGTLQLVAGISAKKIYVCSLILVAPSAVSVSLSEGSAANCATSSQAGVIGVATNGTAANGLPLAANGGLTLGNGGGTVAATATAANYLCLFQSGTAQLAGNLTYVQQ